MASQLLKAGDAALLLPQAARCKGPLDRLLIAHEACSACFVRRFGNSVSGLKPHNMVKLKRRLSYECHGRKINIGS